MTLSLTHWLSILPKCNPSLCELLTSVTDCCIFKKKKKRLVFTRWTFRCLKNSLRVCRPQRGQSLRSFLQVGHRVQSKFYTLLETIMRCWHSFSWKCLKPSVVFDHYLTWCSSPCQWGKCNLIKFNNLKTTKCEKGTECFFFLSFWDIYVLFMAWFFFFID